MSPPEPPPLSPREALRGAHIFLTGTTGFVGKVLLSLVAAELPELRRISLLIRRGRRRSAAERFREEVLTAEPLQAIAGRLDGGLERWAERVSVWEGDITSPRLGLSEEGWGVLTEEDPIDLLLHCAGNVNFDPPLDEALTVNALAAEDKVALAAAAGCPLVHMSTCFVVGGRSGRIEERAPHGGYSPAGVAFDAAREAREAQAAIEAIERESGEQGWARRFAEEARARLERAGLEEGEGTPTQLAEEERAARRRWRRKRLVDEGMERAQRWGWTNTYTYSKSLGEQLLLDAAARAEVPVAIVRPAIVESALAFPFPGWNEGVNTCAPIVYLFWRGQRLTPSRPENLLDVIPVDLVAQGTLLAGVERLVTSRQDRRAALTETPVYQLATGTVNPLPIGRSIELTNLAWRRRYDQDKPFWQRELLKNLETICVDEQTYQRIGAPAVREAARAGQRLLKVLPGRAQKSLSGLRGALAGLERSANAADKIFELFAPFIREHDPHFVSDAIARLAARLPEEERGPFAPTPEAIDWRHYWIDVHMEGLQRWVFGILDDKVSKKRRGLRCPDLVELFRRSARRYPKRIALQHFGARGDEEALETQAAPSSGEASGAQEALEIVTRYDYQELWDGARCAATGLAERGIGAGDRVLLLSENEPAWVMIFLGILMRGAVPVPLDPALSLDALSRISAKAEARLLVHHERLARPGERLAGAVEELSSSAGRSEASAEANSERAPSQREERDALPSRCPVGELFAEAPLPEEEIDDRDRGEELASLLFTSGTTGDPKGVMLTHQNFCALLNSLHQVFELREGDRFLSVLPLFHSFEFSCGLLLPLSAGASVTYLDALDGATLRAAMRRLKPTAIIGVPALWELLQRRIKERAKDQGEAAKIALSVGQRLNRRLRERYQLNLGPLLFKQVHDQLGGSIRYLVSGGAALDAQVLSSFEGLGFELLEGYGLTEAAPVLSVRRPRQQARGAVGPALPGVELKIAEPDAEGIGEVLARGGNVMRGYLNDAAATEEVLDEEGWLRPGDLGRLDARGALQLSGRQKELIVTAEGKNIYPDELEPRYGDHPLIDEFALLGLPDPRGDQQLAALLVLSEEGEATAPDELRRQLQQHLRRIGGQLATYQRIRRWEISDEALPRTSTRKLKRAELPALFERLRAARGERGEPLDLAEQLGAGDVGALIAILAEISGEERGAISLTTGISDELGLSSLQLAELRARLEALAGAPVDGAAVARASDVAALQQLLEAARRAPTASQGSTEAWASLSGDGGADEEGRPPWAPFEPDLSQPQDLWFNAGAQLGGLLSGIGASLRERLREGTVPVPEPLAEGGRRAIHQARQVAFDRFFNVKVRGQGLIPENEQVIVVANHCSHLDVGLVKYALGPFGEEICSLAAADYFFDQGVKRQFFENFSYLIPLERGAPLEEGLAPALDALEQGFSLLLFPEGTRSSDGELQPLKIGVGYLQRQRPVTILPVYLRGTHRAFGKGRTVPVPRARRLSAKIGPPLSPARFDELCEGMGEAEAYREVARRCEEALIALRDDTRYPWELTPEAEAPAARIDGLLDRLCARLEPSALAEPVSWYLSLSGADGGRWTLSADGAAARWQPGRPPGGKASCVLKCDAALFERMIERGYVPSLGDFAAGLVKTNAPQHLRDLQRAFKLGELQP